MGLNNTCKEHKHTQRSVLRKKPGKRGVYYLAFMIVMVTIVLIVFFSVGSQRLQDRQSAIGVRVQTMNTFLNDFSDDVKRGEYIAGFRALLAMEQHVVETGAFLTDAEQTYLEAFFNGTINGENVTIMENSSFSEYLSRVTLVAQETGMNITVNVTNIYLDQVEPWSIRVTAQLTINLTDQSGRFGWTQLKNFTVDIPIADIIDPLYSVNTLSRVPNTIRKTNITEFVNDAGDANDTTNLQQFYNTSAYRASQTAPSILMRFEGNLSPSLYGIESMVNLNDLSLQDIPVNTERSVIDYLYWGTQPTTDLCDVQNMPSSFRIDTGHKETYEIDELNYTTCP